MSKSFRHTPITTLHRCKGQKQDKRIANRRFRCAERTLLAASLFECLPIYPKKVVSNWVFVGDGKKYYPDTNPKLMRK